jgi:hypothetical protein
LGFGMGLSRLCPALGPVHRPPGYQPRSNLTPHPQPIQTNRPSAPSGKAAAAAEAAAAAGVGNTTTNGPPPNTTPCPAPTPARR